MRHELNILYFSGHYGGGGWGGNGGGFGGGGGCGGGGDWEGVFMKLESIINITGPACFYTHVWRN